MDELRIPRVTQFCPSAPHPSLPQNPNTQMQRNKESHHRLRIAMDTTLPHDAVAVTPNPKLKRPCCYPSTDPTNSDPNRLDALFESFLEFHDSSAISLDLALDRILESRSHDSGKNDVIERALRLGSALTEAAKRSARRRASMHNAAVWALPSDLTIKVILLFAD